MPELPEVETIVRSLRPFLEGKTIESVEILRDNMVTGDRQSLMNLKSATVKTIKRAGKYMLLSLSDDRTLILHLRMSGRLELRAASEPELKYERARFRLNEQIILVFNDLRTLGRMQLVKTDDLSKLKHILKLGPDPLEISKADFLKRLEKKRGTIKSLLLNQTFLAGIGNIYADEACAQAKIDPRRSSETLTKDERERLFIAIQSVLKKGIKNMGTSFSDFAGIRGELGKNQQSLMVYGRSGKPCFTCKTTLKRTVIGQRGTVWCPQCQK